jgi:hypothetical protein
MELQVFILLFLQVVLVDATNSLMRQMWMTPIQVYSLLQNESTCNSHEEYQYLDLKTSNQPFSVTDTQLHRINMVLSNYYKYFIANPSSFASKVATRSDLFYLFQQKEDMTFKRCVVKTPDTIM